MSTAKAKQIKALGQKTRDEQFFDVQFGGKMHCEAFGFKLRYATNLHLRDNAKTANDRTEAKTLHLQWINALTSRFHAACQNKDGQFFRALADVIDDDGSENDWSKRESFIFTHCSIAEQMREPLPSAGQLLRGWKINCGIIPTNKDDLASLWKVYFGSEPMPSYRHIIESRLRPWLHRKNETWANVQIIQIQREAKNMGFDLPRQSRQGLPAGFAIKKRLH